MTNQLQDTTPPRICRQDHTLSWTDDLPVCHLSGVGFSTNQIYREDGFRKEEHEFEDRSFHFQVEGDCYLYGVFDGHDGSRASTFASQRMPAEILLGQLMGSSDDDVKNVLRQGFLAVEKGFFESLDDLLVERATLRMQIPEGMSSYDTCKQYPQFVDRMQSLDDQLSGGTTATICLIHNNKLYVASVGNSRALLCVYDVDRRLRVFQLTEDHTLTNENELQRFQTLGLDVDKIQHNRKLGNHEVYTRCIGDYSVKGGYKDIEILSCAVSDPVISEPEISEGRVLDESCSFLLLMSDGLYKSLEDATGTTHVNADIASMVVAEFGLQATLNGVAQAVVDKVVRLHHDAYMTGSNQIKHTCQKRDDITLLVRNFSHPLPNALSSPTGTVGSMSAPGMPQGPFIARALFSLNPGGSIGHLTNTSTLQSTLQSIRYSNTTSSNDSTQSGDYPSMYQRNQSLHQSLQLDSEGRIEAYVDFSEFYDAWEKMSVEEKDIFNAKVKLMSGCDTIAEESEPQTPNTESESKEIKFQSESTDKLESETADIKGQPSVPPVNDSSQDEIIKQQSE